MPGQLSLMREAINTRLCGSSPFKLGSRDLSLEKCLRMYGYQNTGNARDANFSKLFAVITFFRSSSDMELDSR